MYDHVEKLYRTNCNSDFTKPWNKKTIKKQDIFVT